MMRSLIKCCRMIISARFALRKENFQQKNLETGHSPTKADADSFKG